MSATLDEVKAYLAQQQLTLPDVMIQRWMNKIDALSPCFIGGGYSDDDVWFIYMYTLALIALVSAGDGRVRSQGAPNGASRSFAFGSLGDSWRGYKNLLATVDPNGCVDGLLPKNPDKKYRCAMFVSPGVNEGQP